MTEVNDVILPFPRHRPIGFPRSVRAIPLSSSTNDAFCPTLKGLQQSALDPDIGSVFEIVIDGLTSDAVRQAMQVGLKAAAALGRTPGRCASAPAIGGKLGRFLSSEGADRVSALTFAQSAPSQRLDLSKLTPGRLKDMKPEIQRIAIGTTRQPLLVGDIFVVKGGDAAEIRFDGGSDRFDLLGHGMESGVIQVEGDVGPKAGRRMRGGEIEIRGNAGPWLGSQMSGGRIRVSANAGDSVGGPISGELAGMSGGLILIGGKAGSRPASACGGDGRRQRHFGRLCRGGDDRRHAGAARKDRQPARLSHAARLHCWAAVRSRCRRALPIAGRMNWLLRHCWATRLPSMR